MDEVTVSKLNRITHRFYEESSRGFAAGREKAWPGWQKLLRLLQPVFAGLGHVSVLDIGCGNGRFGRCLEEHLSCPFTYRGFDSSARLIALARERLAHLHSVRCEVRDLVDGSLPRGQFSLVTAFGVLHHVPSYRRRRSLLEQLCQRVEDGGALALSTWRLRSAELLRRKRVPWECSPQRTGEVIDLSQVEKGDHLIAKPGDSPRYCHLVDRAEEAELLDDLPLPLAAAFNCDGRQGSPLNRYFLLAKV